MNLISLDAAKTALHKRDLDRLLPSLATTFKFSIAPVMNFVLGWELTPQRVLEYAQEHGFDKPQPDDDSDDDDSNDTLRRAKKAVIFFTVIDDIHSRASMELVRFRACWDVDGNDVGVFAVLEEEADRLIDVRATAADLPPEEDLVDLRTLLNHPDPSPKWYIHANGRWPGDDRVRAALDMTFVNGGDSSGEGSAVEGEVGGRKVEGGETEVEAESTPKMSADVTKTTSQMEELQI